MPCLKIQTNIQIEKTRIRAEQKEISRLLSEWLGKQEAFVMVILDTDKQMSFGGNNESCAFCELISLGLGEDRIRELSGKLCATLQERLGIPEERIYIRFEAPPRSHFGWNGKTFA